MTAYVQSVLYAIACPSLCHTVTWMNQSKTVEFTITQFSFAYTKSTISAFGISTDKSEILTGSPSEGIKQG